MPDADGSFKGISVPAQAWERIFAPTHLHCPEHGPVHDIQHEPHTSIPYHTACGRDVTPCS